MTEPLRSLDARDYHVAWISAVGKDLLIASAMFDEEHGCPTGISEDDSHAYLFGRIGLHNVVMAILPQGRAGVEQIGRLAENVTRSFGRLRFGLMVGTAGGAPSKENDIRLGDVVVSTPNNSKRLGGVVHYFFGASIQEAGFERRGSLNSPPDSLLSAVALLWQKHHRGHLQIDDLIRKLIYDNAPDYDNYKRPPRSSDVLFKPTFLHPPGVDTCTTVCQARASETIARKARPERAQVKIHHGVIGSASNLMRDASLRDKIAKEDGVVCFETESASLMDNKTGWLVVRGICNYSDTHKNDTWQNYAAAAAAVYAKHLLETVRPLSEQVTMFTATTAAGSRHEGRNRYGQICPPPIS